ncbi:hypothetical protein PF005_g19981 [Phytophthora fragariae]|uniref:Uncharacterized protein n=1 Tax=Phytophthora fragariae TaxID=53985 RepID=A0A6A3SH30_9STRA|nr:hypothetical protein PF003_g13329 [Phytophthora fragariae]KAE8926952.1 hypothetical protein PF009_g22871 [Phytophthora fragariae]KAE9078370.1 hypothetical protein PF010_g23150 [Phytophthora fragariae]KAE9084384.1 hypothetical protein PF007_g21541 [Phytophthora fragariae]KAE9116513.1 hypothetical protein PF006_g19021 [Phytophthora fragariae]
MFNERVFLAFKTLAPNEERSKNAVEDKMQALREMYRFISDVNANRIAGSTGKPDWFELSKKEKRGLRNLHRMKSPNVSQEVYDELHRFLNDMADIVPLTSSFVAQPRYDEENTQLAARPDATEGLFGDDADSDRTENDPFNSGRKSDKYE